jgi:hypothetical protein
MLSTPTFSSESLQSVASQLGHQPSTLARESTQGGIPVEMAETFDVYEMGLDPLTSSAVRLRSAVKSTGQWHHQIRHGSDAREFALSVPHSLHSQDRLIQVAFTSDIAKQIDATIDWMDRNADQMPDGIVHLLFVPSLLLHAFWVETTGSDYVVVIDLPDGMRSLQRELFYRGEEFLEILNSIPRGNAFGPPP